MDCEGKKKKKKGVGVGVVVGGVNKKKETYEHGDLLLKDVQDVMLEARILVPLDVLGAFVKDMADQLFGPAEVLDPVILLADGIKEGVLRPRVPAFRGCRNYSSCYKEHPF